MNAAHCLDNAADRAKGAFWERQFCIMAAATGRMFTPHQLKHAGSVVAYQRDDSKKLNVYTLPDVTVWSAPTEHHEVKHKNPTRGGEFGLEKYRFDALVHFARETQQDVLYTIHNHDLSGGPDVRINDATHWIAANVLDLNESNYRVSFGSSWIAGVRHDNVKILYWRTSLWSPLLDLWSERVAVRGARENLG